jgi:site-specific DNA-methyltransferase (adenine-specific)
MANGGKMQNIIGAGQDTARPAPKINTIYCENCLETMSRMSDSFVDLVLTSPPYDDFREYNGYTFDFNSVAVELYRILKTGACAVWVVGDKTENGSETGTSFRQALRFMELGFNLNDTMIYEKTNPIPQPTSKRYAQSFEYMFVFCKGLVSTFNPINERTLDYYKAWKNKGKTNRNKNGINKDKVCHWNEVRKVSNIFKYSLSRWSNDCQSKHPATFPEQLANDHILSWSNPGDLVYDPFLGSGTTAKMALINGRNFIGSEVSEEYCGIAEERIHALRSHAQNTKEICHTAPNSAVMVKNVR